MLLWACTGDPSNGDTYETAPTHSMDTESAGETSDTESSDTEPVDTGPFDDCDRAGYGSLAELTDPDVLREALRQATDGLECDYSDARDTMFLELDNVDGYVTCVYTGERVAVADERPDGEVMNTEHTWPQSQGAGDVPAKCDLHHLFPTMSDANALRASYPFGEVVTVTESLGLSSLGYTAEGELAFEPPEAHKGDVARALLYFSVRYALELDEAQFSVAQAWHTLDPVDERELTRTLGIEAAQGHANPFVVCPDFAALVDGTP